MDRSGSAKRAITAADGNEALEQITGRQPALVLTDLRLEDGDGLDVLKAVRDSYPETVTIMLTGYASLESAIQALRAGAYDYLVKPSEVEELRATVARGLERRRLGQELRARVAELADLNASLQRRIDEATKYAALDQLCLSPQCGFASTEEGNVLAEEEQWAKLRMVVELADEVSR